MKKIFIITLILTWCSTSFSQMNTLLDHDINTKIQQLTTYQMSNDQVIRREEMDSSTYYFNNHNGADSIVFFKDGITSYKITFKYIDDQLIKKHFSGVVMKKNLDMLWEKSYSYDTVFTTFKKQGKLITTDTTITHKSDSIHTIITKSKRFIKTYNSDGLIIKTEIFVDLNSLMMTLEYQYDEYKQRIKIIKKDNDGIDTSTDHFKFKLDDKGNWIEKTEFDIVDLKERVSPSKTIRHIIY